MNVTSLLSDISWIFRSNSISDSLPWRLFSNRHDDWREMDRILSRLHCLHGITCVCVRLLSIDRIRICLRRFFPSKRKTLLCLSLLVMVGMNGWIDADYAQQVLLHPSNCRCCLRKSASGRRAPSTEWTNISVTGSGGGRALRPWENRDKWKRTCIHIKFQYCTFVGHRVLAVWFLSDNNNNNNHHRGQGTLWSEFRYKEHVLL